MQKEGSKRDTRLSLNWTPAKGVWIHRTNTRESNQQICIWLPPVSSGVFISVVLSVDSDSLKIQLNPIKLAVLPCQQYLSLLTTRTKISFSYFYWEKIIDYSWKSCFKSCKYDLLIEKTYHNENLKNSNIL